MFVNDYISIGVILKPYRNNGNILVDIDPVFWPDLLQASAVFLKIDELQVPYFIQSFEPSEESSLLKLEELDAPEKIRRFNGEFIFLNIRDVSDKTLKQTELNAPEYFKQFMIICNKTGAAYLIEKIEQYPQQIMATVEVNGDIKLIPLVEAWITETDQENRKIYMDLPEGLI